MSAERIDPEVIDAAIEAQFAHKPIRGGIIGDAEREAMEAALRAADEKRRELAQADPAGQEYTYRVCWENPAGKIERRTRHESEELARVWAKIWVSHPWWVERALLGTWERVES